MKGRYIVASDPVFESFNDVETAKEFAKETAEKTKERTIVYLQCGTMCAAVAVFGEE